MIVFQRGHGSVLTIDRGRKEDRGTKKNVLDIQKRGCILLVEEKDVLCKDEKVELTSNLNCCSMKEEIVKTEIERNKQPEERTR